MSHTMNPCRYQGFLTDEDRKKPLFHKGSYMIFHSNLELSEPVRMRLFGQSSQISLNDYSNDIMWFAAWFTDQVLPFLNGFQGFTRIRFIPEGFEIVDTEKNE